MIKKAIPQPLPQKGEGVNQASTADKVAQLAEQRLTGDTHLWPDEYDGVKYANIIEAWLQSKGIYGGVAQGNRNNMFYQLALELRYICDFKKDWLLQVMPSWDMQLAEREQTVKNALNRPQGRNLPDALLAAISKVKNLGDISEMDEQAVSNQMRNPLPATLPYVFRLIARRFPNNPHAMILCSLPPLGALCTQVRSNYIDGEEESPLFYCILTSPQASGKKVVRKLDDMLTFPIREHDDEQRAMMMEYKKELKRSKNKKEQPEEPKTNIRKVPAKISQRVFLERTFYAEGKSLYSFGEELDTLTKAMKGGSWADLGDILRLGFDAGEFGSDYASENSFNAVCRARWCMLLAGTWGAVERFFPNLEDGTMTRFMFAQLEDSLGKPLLPKAQANVNTFEQGIRDEARRLYDTCSQDEEIKVALPRTINALLEWQALQIRIFNLGGKSDVAHDTLRRRAMLMGFRAALVAAATEKMKDSQTVANFAVWVAQEVLDQQMALFAKGLNSVSRTEMRIKNEAQQQLRNNSTLKILAQLPDEFLTEDVDEIRAGMGMISDSHKMLSRWTRSGYITSIMREGKKIYIKVNK